jgi:hypothetical protein
MAKKRGARLAPPPRSGEWKVLSADQDAYDGWETLCNQAPGPTRDAYEIITKAPRLRSGRQEQLRGKELSTKVVRGVVVEQWQYEVTGGGRIWYCIDDERHELVVIRATLKHPKETE